MTIKAEIKKWRAVQRAEQKELQKRVNDEFDAKTGVANEAENLAISSYQEEPFETHLAALEAAIARYRTAKARRVEFENALT